MKTNQFLAGAARSGRALLCFLAAICFTQSGNGQVNNFKPAQTKMTLIAKKVQQIYTSQIGIREKGTNSGPAVEQYLHYVNLPKGNPWCAAFVCWVFGRAGVENPRSGWSPDLFASRRIIWSRDVSPVSGIKYQESRSVGGKLTKFAQRAADGNNLASRNAYVQRTKSDFLPLTSAFQSPCSPTCPIPTSDFRLLTSNKPPISFNLPTPTSDLRLPTSNPRPQAGDVFGLFFPEKKRIAHTGFIDQWDGTWLITVEGNTNLSGSREGDGVYRKRRLVRSIYKVARYVE